jgi:branched-chain amino acid transport system permease protein
MTDFQLPLQALVYGIISGAFYGLAAVGLALVFGVMKMLNVAHGSLIMIGAYGVFWLFSLGHIDPIAALPLVAFFLFLLGALLYILIFSPTAKLPEEQRVKNSLLISFGLWLVLENVALLLWKADERSISTFYTGKVLDLFGVRLPFVGLGGIILAVIVILALQLFLTKTDFGRSVRAAAEDWQAAALMGVNTNFVYLIAFSLGIGLAGIAGTLIGVAHAIHPGIGLEWTNKSLIILVLAGLGNIGTVFIAGLLLGVVEGISFMVISFSYREVVGLVIFILVLILKPEGLLTKKVG